MMYLQYKMFLLNELKKQGFRRTKKFTIQNVSIKFNISCASTLPFLHLQYKMFLLNLEKIRLRLENKLIYNTKCFY